MKRNTWLAKATKLEGKKKSISIGNAREFYKSLIRIAAEEMIENNVSEALGSETVMLFATDVSAAASKILKKRGPKSGAV